MKQNKLKPTFKIILALVGVLLAGYFFILPFDYQINLKTKQAPLTVYGFIQSRSSEVEWSDKVMRFREVPDLEGLEDIEFIWTVKPINTIETSVSVNVNFLQDRYLEKLRVLGVQSQKVDNSIEYISSFSKKLSNDLKKFRWEAPQKGTLESSRCLCIPINSLIKDKATQMNEKVDDLTTYISGDKLSPPRMYVYEIHQRTLFMKAELCFSIDETFDKVIECPVYIKDVPAIEGKVYDFYGNYNKSERGWFQLIKTAKLENKKFEFPFAEVFFDSPFSNTNDTKWLSKTYYKLK